MMVTQAKKCSGVNVRECDAGQQHADDEDHRRVRVDLRLVDGFRSDGKLLFSAHELAVAAQGTESRADLKYKRCDQNGRDIAQRQDADRVIEVVERTAARHVRVDFRHRQRTAAGAAAHDRQEEHGHDAVCGNADQRTGEEPERRREDQSSQHDGCVRRERSLQDRRLDTQHAAADQRGQHEIQEPVVDDLCLQILDLFRPDEPPTREERRARPCHHESAAEQGFQDPNPLADGKKKSPMAQSTENAPATPATGNWPSARMPTASTVLSA